MQYKAILQTPNKSAGKNACEFLILHHTATGDGTIKGVLNGFTIKPKDPEKAKSCHYVVDTNGDIYKI